MSPFHHPEKRHVSIGKPIQHEIVANNIPDVAFPGREGRERVRVSSLNRVEHLERGLPSDGGSFDYVYHKPIRSSLRAPSLVAITFDAHIETRANKII